MLALAVNVGVAWMLYRYRHGDAPCARRGGRRASLTKARAARPPVGPPPQPGAHQTGAAPASFSTSRAMMSCWTSVAPS